MQIKFILATFTFLMITPLSARAAVDTCNFQCGIYGLFREPAGASTKDTLFYFDVEKNEIVYVTDFTLTGNAAKENLTLVSVNGAEVNETCDPVSN